MRGPRAARPAPPRSSRAAGKRRGAQFIHKWLEGYDGMTIFKRFDFVPPGLECSPDVYNTWKPWPCASFELTTDRDRLTHLLASVLKHIAILANHKRSNYEFIMKFFAQYVQYVHKKGGVMLILSGVQGCGKSTFVKLLKRMFGPQFFSTSRPEQNVWGRFNPEMEGKTLVELSELDRGNVHGSIDQVKDLISNDTMWIEGKGTNGYTMRNYARFVGITNDPVPVHEGRRNGCVECSPELAYHKPIGRVQCRCAGCVRLSAYHAEMNDVVMVDPNTARVVYEYWRAYDLQGREVLAEVDLPVNEMHERIAEASLSQQERFLRHLAVNDGPSKYSPGELWREFSVWQQEFEPGKGSIKGESDLRGKMGVLCARNHGCAKLQQRLPAVTNESGVKMRYPKQNIWSFDRVELCRHFGIDLDSGDDTQPQITAFACEEVGAPMPDLDDEARTFVHQYLGEADTAGDGCADVHVAVELGDDMQCDNSHEEELIEREMCRHAFFTSRRRGDPVRMRVLYM